MNQNIDETDWDDIVHQLTVFQVVFGIYKLCYLPKYINSKALIVKDLMALIPNNLKMLNKDEKVVKFCIKLIVDQLACELIKGVFLL